MDPRSESQPWPAGITPTRAWTKEIGGKTYTIKPIHNRRFGIWHEAEELGTFALSGDDPPRPIGPPDLTIEARGVVEVFILEMDRHAAVRGPEE